MTSSPLPRMPLVWGLSPKPAHPLGKEEIRKWCSSSQISASQEAAGFLAGSCGGNVQGALSCSHNSEDQAPEPQARGSRSPQGLTSAPPLCVHTLLCLELLCQAGDGIRSEPLCSAHPPTHLPCNQSNQGCSALSTSLPSNLPPRKCS